MRMSQRSHAGRWGEGCREAVLADFCETGGGISLRIEMARHYKKWGWVLLAGSKNQTEKTMLRLYGLDRSLRDAGGSVCFWQRLRRDDPGKLFAGELAY